MDGTLCAPSFFPKAGLFLSFKYQPLAETKELGEHADVSFASHRARKLAAYPFVAITIVIIPITGRLFSSDRIHPYLKWRLGPFRSTPNKTPISEHGSIPDARCNSYLAFASA